MDTPPNEQTQTQEPPQEPQEGAQPDPMARIDERFAELEPRLNEQIGSAVRDGVTQALGGSYPPPDPGMEGAYPPDPALYGDPGMDPQAPYQDPSTLAGQGYPQPQVDQYGNPVPQQGYDPSVDPRMAGVADPRGNPQQALAQMLHQQLTPLQEQIQVMRIEQDAQALQGEFPELSEPDAAKSLMDQANQAAMMIGRPDLAIQPGFLRLVHQAGKASTAAAGETPATGEGPELEGGGGAVQPEPQTDPADDILSVSAPASAAGETADIYGIRR